MKKNFGDFEEQKDSDHEHLEITFSPTSRPLQQRWRNNGLSADFLADYLSTFFPGEDSSSQERQTELKDAISFIANELLENAMKFNHAPSQDPVSIEMYLAEDEVSLYVTNSVAPQTIADFQNFLQRLLTEDTDELYMEQLMQNAEKEDTDDENTTRSGLGYLTMINDYGVKLAWKFEPPEPDSDGMMVTTMAQLKVYISYAVCCAGLL
jgi:hypothetical protein